MALCPGFMATRTRERGHSASEMMKSSIKEKLTHAIVKCLNVRNCGGSLGIQIDRIRVAE